MVRIFIYLDTILIKAKPQELLRLHILALSVSSESPRVFSKYLKPSYINQFSQFRLNKYSWQMSGFAS